MRPVRSFAADGLAARLASDDPLEAARALLGVHIVAQRADGVVRLRISDVEAYGGPEDPASHAVATTGQRAAVMAGAPGTAYVYLSHGVHWCLNVVCRPVGHPAAVLLRAGTIVEGIDVVHARRRGRPRLAEKMLACGPGRLGLALAVGAADQGRDLFGGCALRLEPGEPVRDSDVVAGPRVGVRAAGAAAPWRLALRSDRAVNGLGGHGGRRPARAGTVEP